MPRLDITADASVAAEIADFSEAHKHNANNVSEGFHSGKVGGLGYIEDDLSHGLGILSIESYSLESRIDKKKKRMMPKRQLEHELQSNNLS